MLLLLYCIAVKLDFVWNGIVAVDPLILGDQMFQSNLNRVTTDTDTPTDQYQF